MVTRSFIRLGPDLVYELKLSLQTTLTTKNTICGTLSTRYKKHNDPIVMSAFQDFLHISPDIFDLDDLVSKKPVLAKEKVSYIQKEKNT